MATSENHGEDPLQQALRVVMTMLPLDEVVIEEEVIDACGDVHTLFSKRGKSVDLATLRTEALERYAVWQEPSIGLDDAKDHVEWLPEARATLGDRKSVV